MIMKYVIRMRRCQDKTFTHLYIYYTTTSYNAQVMGLIKVKSKPLSLLNGPPAHQIRRPLHTVYLKRYENIPMDDLEDTSRNILRPTSKSNNLK